MSVSGEVMSEDRETERRGRGPDSRRDGDGEGGALKAHAPCYPQPGAGWGGEGGDIERLLALMKRLVAAMGKG